MFVTMVMMMVRTIMMVMVWTTMIIMKTTTLYLHVGLHDAASKQGGIKRLSCIECESHTTCQSLFRVYHTYAGSAGQGEQI